MDRFAIISFLSCEHTYVFPFALRQAPSMSLDKLVAEIKGAVEVKFAVKEYVALVGNAQMEHRVSDLLGLPRVQLHLHLVIQSQAGVKRIKQRDVPLFKRLNPLGPSAQEELLIELPGFFNVGPRTIGGFPIAEFSVRAPRSVP
jgi:hypothetical protein